MKSVDSKLLLGLVVGAAVGAAVGYLAATDKREDLLNELNNVVGKVKEGFNTALAKYKEGKILRKSSKISKKIFQLILT